MRKEAINEGWNADGLENWFRHETTMTDEACRALARKLTKKNWINLIIKSDPSSYNHRIE